MNLHRVLTSINNETGPEVRNLFRPLRHWENENNGLVLIVGNRTKTCYFQKDVGSQTKWALIGRFPVMCSQAASQTAMALALEMERGTGKATRIGAPTLQLQWKSNWRGQNCDRSPTSTAYMNKQLEDWLRVPLAEISKSMVLRQHQHLAAKLSTTKDALRHFRSFYIMAAAHIIFPSARR